MEDAIVTFEVDGFTFVYENLSFLTISLKETGIREIQSLEGGDVVSASSYQIAPERSISILFHSQILGEDLLSCQIYIWDELTAELGYSHCPPFRTIAPLATRLVEIPNRLRIDYDQVCGHNDMPGGYYFFVDMEIITHHEIQIVDVINIEDDEEEEDGLLDEQVTSQRTTLS
ncbi:hypothetical protein FEM48_Zijuj03G0003400 [Ziziphus jujuba var. spinosa]|uniref:Uncharacterized protein n=1 Tax=Ziziphus jujuba var. spinosa TaxID=714518 RepID=A0A978VM39_ZIZJJ|nr:hypothetical protein FEM48_Zijuj03G0003400 [Ziziphus jujuba var. spinosa]